MYTGRPDAGKSRIIPLWPHRTSGSFLIAVQTWSEKKKWVSFPILSVNSLSCFLICFYVLLADYYGILCHCFAIRILLQAFMLKDFHLTLSHLSLSFVSNLISSPFFPWASASLLLTFVRFAGLYVYVFVCLNVCLCELLLCVACLIFIVRNLFSKIHVMHACEHFSSKWILWDFQSL